MSQAFKVGDVCIWQNCVGEWAYLNGIETTITGELEVGIDLQTRDYDVGYLTDTREPGGKFFLQAGAHELRRKDPPTTGEQRIRTMFDDTSLDVATVDSDVAALAGKDLFANQALDVCTERLKVAPQYAQVTSRNFSYVLNGFLGNQTTALNTVNHNWERHPPVQRVRNRNSGEGNIHVRLLISESGILA
jgi:hypothetical protein